MTVELSLRSGLFVAHIYPLSSGALRNIEAVLSIQAENYLNQQTKGGFTGHCHVFMLAFLLSSDIRSEGSIVIAKKILLIFFYDF